jgi:hypothetical protein
MLTVLLAKIRAVLVPVKTHHPLASTIAYSTGVDIEVADAALSLLGEDLAAWVIDHRRGEIRDADSADWRIFFGSPAPASKVWEAHDGTWRVSVHRRGETMQDFGATFRDQSQALRVSWQIYRQAIEADPSEIDALAEYQRALDEAATTKAARR